MKISNPIKWNKLAGHLLRGQQAERRACRFLIERGFKHVLSNYRCRHGEIDLIMEDNSYLIFVEVRYRSSNAYGGAAASIGPLKQTRLRAAAQHYLQHLRSSADRPCRFDVVLLGPQPQTAITWIKNAF